MDTLLGGCCTIFLVLAALISFPFLLWQEVSQPTWTNSQYTSYLDKNNVTMSTQDYILAANLTTDVELGDIAKSWQIVYKASEDEDEYFQPVWCSEFYAEQISNGEQFFVESFGGKDDAKVCPNTTAIHSGLIMEVVDCSIA